MANLTTNPPQYRLKPPMIQAIQWDGSLQLTQEVSDWVARNEETLPTFNPESPELGLEVTTRRGLVTALPGNYITLDADGRWDVLTTAEFNSKYEA